MYDLKMIKIILSFLIVTILAVSSAAFGTHTRLQTSPNVSAAIVMKVNNFKFPIS